MNGAASPAGDHHHQDCPSGERFPQLQLWWLVLALFCLPAAAPAGGDTRSLLVDGRQVPVFATPAEQLAYARANFDDPEEKAAALKALERIHPAAREQAAMAALELAFAALGDDYRLADKNQYDLARRSYLAALEKYPDLPAIAAKALWYLGWIACDLEDDPRQGIRWYERLITLYPEEKLSSVAPVPWLTIRQDEPGQQQHAVSPQAVLTWKDIAHLEIIRHADTRARAERSFAAIQQGGAGEAFTAAALKVLVEHHGFDEHSERLARAYLQQAGPGDALKNDLLLDLSLSRLQAEGRGGPP